MCTCPGDCRSCIIEYEKRRNQYEQDLIIQLEHKLRREKYLKLGRGQIYTPGDVLPDWLVSAGYGEGC